jgi:predicted PurR-regulated permease PerM
MPGHGSPPSPGPHRVRDTLQVILLVLAVALGLVILYRIQGVILAVILSVFFAYLIAPLVFMIEGALRRPSWPRSTSRALAAGMLYVSMMAAVTLAGVLLVPRLSAQASAIAAEAPVYVETIRTWGAQWIAWERAQLPAEVQAHVDEAIATGTATVVAYVQHSAVAALEVVTLIPWLVLIPVLAFFFLKDLDELRYYAVQALPSAWRGPAYRLVQELNTALAAYMRAQLLACLFIGVTCGLGFAILGVPYATLLGALAGVLEFIPLVGPLVTAVIAAVVAAVQAPVLALWLTIFLVLLRIVQDYVVYPRLIGQGTHLHPLTIILGVLIGAELGGIVGIFLAVPALATLTVAYRHGVDWTRTPTAVPHASTQESVHDPPVRAAEVLREETQAVPSHR